MRPALTLGTYLALLATYHLLDFTIEHGRSGSRLSLDALLLSPEYCAAMGLSLAEYVLELWLAPGWKAASRASAACYTAGLAGMVFGDGLRKLAMLQNRGFTHLISTARREGHELVTTGVYRLWRHPGYAGWYYWAVSSQVLLMNPVSCMAFALVGAWFFRERVRFEEDTLARLFGRRYGEYASRTGIWIPGVRGAFRRVRGGERERGRSQGRSQSQSPPGAPGSGRAPPTAAAPAPPTAEPQSGAHA